MDTASPLVSRRVHADRLSMLLVALAIIGLLLVGVGLGLDPGVPKPAADPLLAPFRWQPLAFGLA